MNARRWRGRGRTRRLSVLALGGAVALTTAPGPAGAERGSADAVVAVVAPEGLRLADELKRELEISGFAVTVVETAAPAAGLDVKPDWSERIHALAAAQPGRTVAVRGDERQIVLLSPGSATAPGVQTSFELQLAPEERSARRRACLTVVEYLRVLAESADRAAVKQAVEDRPPSTVQATAEKSSSASDPLPVPPPSAQVDGTPLSPALPWTMGVATTLDLSSSGGQPAGHLQFMWYFPFGPRVSLRARVAWPVLGADLHVGDTEIRMWTFGAAVGLQYTFSDPRARWRPFVGLAIGNLIALSEAVSPFTSQSRTAITAGATVGLELGLRYAVGARMQLFGELEGTRGWLGPTATETSPEDDLARAIAFHTSLGILFDY